MTEINNSYRNPYDELKPVGFQKCLNDMPQASILMIRSHQKDNVVVFQPVCEPLLLFWGLRLEVRFLNFSRIISPGDAPQPHPFCVEVFLLLRVEIKHWTVGIKAAAEVSCFRKLWRLLTNRYLISVLTGVWSEIWWHSNIYCNSSEEHIVAW